MSYQWINTHEIVGIEDHRVVVFGAGKGAEEFLSYLQASDINVTIEAIADNDESFWSNTLCGYTIVSPEKIGDIPFDKIVVTSISGRESITRQLEDMGFRYPDDFILIGKYTSAHIPNFKKFISGMKSLGLDNRIKGAHCLHIGPGGFLGLEVLLYCFGMSRITSIDKYTFAMNYPEIAGNQEDYLKIRQSIESLAGSVTEKREALRRFEEIIISRGDRIYLNPDRIDYICPVDMIDLQFVDESFDFILSFAVLEHVSHPGAAVENVARTLKQGGIGFHGIITRDHRCFSSVSGYHPFSFRCHNQREWDRINRRKLYQNRLLPIEWKAKFIESGLQIQEYHITEEIEINDQTLSSFHSDFNKFSLKELSEADCTIIAQKPPAGGGTK